MPVRHRSLLFGLGLGLAASASAAPNLLTNSHFDTDLSGWISVNDSLSQMTFDATLDANSSPSSGSAKFSKAAGMACVPNLYQCVSGVTPGKPYDFGGSAYIPLGQPANSNAFVDLAWFAGAACSGGRIVSPAAGPVLTTGAWTGVSQIGQVAPAGVASAAVNIAACNAMALPLQTNFDELFFQEGVPAPLLPFTNLILIVEGPIRVPPGVPVQFRIRVRNLGAQAALGIRAGVYLPPGLAGVVVAGGGSYDSVQGWLSWPLFDQIDVGGEQVFTFTLPDPVNGKGYAVAAMLNGDTDYSNNTVAFQLAAATATAVPALAPWGFGVLWLLLVAAAASRFARSRDRM